MPRNSKSQLIEVSVLFWTFFLPLILITQVYPVTNRNFTLGFLCPFSPPCGGGASYCCNMYASAITLAVEKVNSDSQLLVGHKLGYIWNDTACDETKAVRQQLYQLDAGVDAFIGPGCECKTAAIVAEAVNKTLISYYCLSSSFEGKRLPRTYLRTVGMGNEHLVPSIVSLLERFEWRYVQIIYEKMEGFLDLRDRLVSKLDQDQIRNITELTSEDADNVNEEIVKSKFQNVRHQSKILIFLTTIDTSRPTIYWLRKLNLVLDDTVFIICERKAETLISYTYFNEGHKLLWDFTLPTNGKLESDLLSRSLLETLDNVFMIAVETPVGEKYEKFASEVRNRSPEYPFESDAYVNYTDTPPPIQAASLYDAVMLYAHGLNLTLAKEQPLMGENIVENIMSMGKFNSIRGLSMTLDRRTAAAQYNFLLYQIRNTSNYSKVLTRVGTFVIKSDSNESKTQSSLRLDNKIIWPNDRDTAPPDTPECGWSLVCDAGHSPERDFTRIIISIVSVVCGALFLLLVVLFLRQWKLQKELKSQLWKIKFSDLMFYLREGSPMFEPDETLQSEPEALFESTKSKWTAVAQYKSEGDQVVVSKFPAQRISLTRNDHIDLKRMRDVRHKNLNPFVGACIDYPHVCIVMNYCSRGSLRDFLENVDVSMDHLFVMSLVTDIVRGMAFLHNSEIISHGNLKSSNCLIDSHWVLKITDYGLPEFRTKAMKEINADHYEDLFWVAPELLRMPCRPLQGTQKGDVYSFAIILQEFHTRSGPYSENKDLNSKEIIYRVRQENYPPFRPTISSCIEKDENGELYMLMLDCWDEVPALRPDFNDISKSVQKMASNQGIKTNIVDNMVYMLSKYSDDLEGVVQERTEMLLEEQKKTDALLEQMLPRPVADELKRNGNVEAESFDEVTIYFSDIVGFTSLSADSTPMQVVTMLNDLYLMFDEIIREYDVYKVETIGDAYMVVSGLPIHNGHNHASEISRMALHLLAAVKSDFIVRHKPNYQLKLRIGIHSGPVVAGVVGSIMPRYCLFGDTVNTASRMESSGEALCIHLSRETKEILDNLGGFKLESRGEVEIKGKGKVETFWLTDASNLKSSVRKRTETAGFLRRGSLLARQRLGSLKRSLKGRMSPGMPRKLTLMDGQAVENIGHENNLHRNVTLREARLCPLQDQRDLTSGGNVLERQNLLTDIVST